MKGRVGLLLTAVALLFATIAVSAAAADTWERFAAGSGHFELTSADGVTALRTFAFEVRQEGDGSVSGDAQVYNRAVDHRLHVRIDCLNVFGNIAVMSGSSPMQQAPISPRGTPSSSRCRTTAKAPTPPPTASRASSTTPDSSAPTLRRQTPTTRCSSRLQEETSSFASENGA
jgi:hypothetical protein